MRPDVIVIGSGVTGAAVTFRLAQTARQVLCIAPRDGSTATRASGAMLGVLGEITGPLQGTATLADFETRLAANDRYEDWLAELREAGGGAVAASAGTFVVAGAHRPSDRVAIEAIEDVARARGLPCERVTIEDVPGLAPCSTDGIHRVLWLAQESHVDPDALIRGLLKAISASGQAAQLDDCVTQIVQREGRVIGVWTTGHGLLEAEHVVLCAGAGVQKILDASGDLADALPGVLGGKGVSVLLKAPQSTSRALPTHPIRTPNREFACGLHLLPRDGQFYVGATNRVSRHPGITGRATVEEVALLLKSATTELVAGLGAWDIADLRHGERPLASDGRPLAGATDIAGLSVATGGYRNGVLLAPLLADLVAGETGEVASWLSPRSRGSKRATHAEASGIFDTGLAQLERLINDPYGGAGWLVGVDAVLPRRAASAATDAALRDHAIAVLRDYPLVTMVPEAIIEFAQLQGADEGA